MDSAATQADIAARLKVARSRLFGTAADAARALGMKPVTVRAHESGQNGVGHYDLERYARRYGVSLVWLLTGEGEADASASFDTRFQHGQLLVVHSLVEDGVWLPSDEDSPFLPTRVPLAPNGEPEFVVYTDPRFPAETVSAFKVATQKTDGAYLNGSVVFAVPKELVGYRNDDHVLVLSSRGDFYEWSLRRVEMGVGFNRWIAITSDSPPLEYKWDADGTSEVVGVVIGSETRRPVPPMDQRDRRELEIGLAIEEGRRLRLPPLSSGDIEDHDAIMGAVVKRMNNKML